MNGVNIPDTRKWISTPNLASSYKVVVKLLAYADDLIVFLRDVEEWETLQDLLQTYGRASNAKINLQKTTMLSMTGRPHQRWQDLTNRTGITWHDSSNTAPAIYLGYPLYHNMEQLTTFLTGLTNKLQRHINMVKGRNLSVKGKAIVVNSLLLSRIWHVTRVTIVPPEWIQVIDKLVRNYVFSFYPHPSLNFICRHKTEGGLGIIHTRDQVLALHNVYLNRLLSNSSPNPLTGVINVLVRLHTGHNSILPFLLSPALYARKFTKMPHLHHLAKLIQRLPPITISSLWTPRITRYVPLEVAVRPSTHTTTPITYNKTEIVQDFLRYDSINNEYDRYYIQPATQHRQLWLALIDGEYQWHPVLAAQQTPQYTLPTPTGPSWFNVQSLEHWVITHTTWNKKGEATITTFPVHVAKPSDLRRHWLHQSEGMHGLPPPKPPEAPPPASFMSRTQCKRFWQLPMPHKARNCWWRFLIHKLPTRLGTRHAHGRPRMDTQCTLCGEPFEDNAHWIFHCPKKRSFWLVARYVSGIDADLPQIWEFLTLQTNTDKATLLRLSHILLVIWQMHWHCIFNEVPWNTTHALEHLRRLRWLSGTVPHR